MDAAQVKDKYAIDVNPHIVISGKFKDHRRRTTAVIVLYHSALRLIKICPDIHSKIEIVCLIKTVNRFIVPRITVIQSFAGIVIQIMITDIGWIKRIIGHEITALIKVRIFTRWRSQLVVYGEILISVIFQCGKIFRTVEVKFSVSIKILLEEQVVYSII